MTNILNKIFSTIRIFFLKKNNVTQNIIILSFKFLGDTVFTIPAIRLIQKLFPKHQIIIFCYESNKLIYDLEFKGVQYIIFNKNDLDLENRKFNLKFLKAKKNFNNYNAEYFFDFSSNYKTAILSLLSGINYTFGSGNRLLSGFYYSFIFNTPETAIDIFLNSVKKIDNSDFYKDCLKFKEKFFKDKEIMLIPSAGWDAKKWGTKKFIELITKLKINYQAKIITEPGFFSIDEIEYLLENDIKYIVTENIQTLISEIRNSSVLVSNDTGPIYIAALMGIPTFTIYGPTGPLFHKIPGYHHQYFRKEIKCSPSLSEKLCFTFGGRDGCPSNECMLLLSVNEVYLQLTEFLRYLNIRNKN